MLTRKLESSQLRKSSKTIVSDSAVAGGSLFSERCLERMSKIFPGIEFSTAQVGLWIMMVPCISTNCTKIGS